MVTCIIKNIKNGKFKIKNGNINLLYGNQIMFNIINGYKNRLNGNN